MESLVAGEFDEQAWPCAAAFATPYLQACELGRRRMSTLRVVFCALARDVTEYLPRTMANIERMGALFADYRVVVFENDSADDTLRQLQSWQAGNDRVHVLSERLGNPRWPPVRDLERMRQLACYRNRCRELAIQHFAHFDHVITLDSDLLGWSHDGLANTFGHADWDVVASLGLCRWKGRDIFYDCWAFRAVDHPLPHIDVVPVKAMVFPRGTPLIPVLSCFGGLAVYRMEAYRAADYDGTDCEHVALHNKMRLAGFGRIFLNPSMIALYPDFETLHPRSPRTPWWDRALRQPGPASIHLTSVCVPS
jgi:hypothetical protein